MIRKRAKANDDFPAPVLPTIPIFSPGLTEQEKFLRTRSSPGRYLVQKDWKSTAPSDGHLSSGLFFSSSHAACNKKADSVFSWFPLQTSPQMQRFPAESTASPSPVLSMKTCLFWDCAIIFHSLHRNHVSFQFSCTYDESPDCGSCLQWKGDGRSKASQHSISSRIFGRKVLVFTFFKSPAWRKWLTLQPGLQKAWISAALKTVRRKTQQLSPRVPSELPSIWKGREVQRLMENLVNDRLVSQTLADCSYLLPTMSNAKGCCPSSINFSHRAMNSSCLP